MNLKRLYALTVIFCFFLYLIWVNVFVFWFITFVIVVLFYRALIVEWLKDEKVKV